MSGTFCAIEKKIIKARYCVSWTTLSTLFKDTRMAKMRARDTQTRTRFISKDQAGNRITLVISASSSIASLRKWREYSWSGVPHHFLFNFLRQMSPSAIRGQIRSEGRGRGKWSFKSQICHPGFLGLLGTGEGIFCTCAIKMVSCPRRLLLRVSRPVHKNIEGTFH